MSNVVVLSEHRLPPDVPAPERRPIVCIALAARLPDYDDGFHLPESERVTSGSDPVRGLAIALYSVLASLGFGCGVLIGHLAR